MLFILKVLLGGIGGLLLWLGANWMFRPHIIMGEHDVNASSETGKNFIRGDIGGLLLAGGIMIYLFLFQNPSLWFWPGLVLLSAVILGRVVSLIADGKSKKGIQAIVVQLIIIALMVGIIELS